MKKKLVFNLLIIVMGLAVLSGCGKEDKTPPITGETIDLEKPVTLLMNRKIAISDEELQRLYIEPVQKKYPNISIELSDTVDVGELLASGQSPDLIATHVGFLGHYIDYGLLTDITPLVKQYDVDLGRFDNIVLDALRVSNPGELNGLPFTMEFGALYYNKSIFDKFGEDYPKDGMTWDDAMVLAHKLSRKEGDIEYKGLDPYAVTRFQRILGNTVYDPETMKATINTEEWRTIFTLVNDVLRIPGNGWGDREARRGVSDHAKFYRNQTVAMYAGNNLIHVMEEPTRNGFDWDVAQYPSLPTHPNIFTDVDAHLLLISSTSKHKEAAMQVLMAITSDETQMLLTREFAKLPTMSDPKFKEQFAADLDFVKGKNLQSIFKSGVTSSPIRPKYWDESTEFIKEAFYNYYNGTDLNTVLRAAEEKINLFLEGQQ